MKDRRTERQRDRKTERQKDRKTERQKDRKTERQKNSKAVFEYSIQEFVITSIFLKSLKFRVSNSFCRNTVHTFKNTLQGVLFQKRHLVTHYFMALLCFSKQIKIVSALCLDFMKFSNFKVNSSK